MAANVDDGIAGEDARLHRLLDAEVDRRDVLARDLAADDLVDELVAVPRRRRLEIDDHVPVLAAATGLADKAADLLRGPAGRLAIGDCGRPTFASTENSRSRRSTMISRCSSPIPR